jgi:DNA-binding PadR family transcriptional regulator
MALGDSRDERKRTILQYLVKEGPANKYRICKHFVPRSGSEPTYLTAIDEMEAYGLIKPSSVKEKAQGGRPSKHYDLTLAGLMALIASLDDNEKGHGLLNDIAKKYEQLMPSVFDVWPAILKAGVGDIAFRRLQEICMSELEARMVRTDSTDLEPHKVHESFFAIETYHDDKPDDRTRWFQGLMLDRTLRDRMAASIRHQIDYLEDCLKSFEKGKRNAEKILEAIARKDAEN